MIVLVYSGSELLGSVEVKIENDIAVPIPNQVIETERSHQDLFLGIQVELISLASVRPAVYRYLPVDGSNYCYLSLLI